MRGLVGSESMAHCWALKQQARFPGIDRVLVVGGWFWFVLAPAHGLGRDDLLVSWWWV